VSEFRMPSLGADMAAGTLLEWLKQPGDRVARGDLIAEVDTDKGVIQVEAFTTGTLERILVEAGQKVPVGTVMALIRDDAGSPSAAAPPALPPPPPSGRPRSGCLRWLVGARRSWVSISRASRGPEPREP